MDNTEVKVNFCNKIVNVLSTVKTDEEYENKKSLFNVDQNTEINEQKCVQIQPITVASSSGLIVNIIDVANQDLVFGYIRSNKSQNINAMPMVLMQICLLYYYEHDNWDSIDTSKNIQVDNYCIIYKSDYQFPNSAVLKRKVNSGKHHWRFKIEKTGNNCSECNCIGIWKTKTKSQIKFDSDQHFAGFGYGFAYENGLLMDESCWGDYDFNEDKFYSKENHYGKQCVEKDIIDMYLDMPNLQLSYAINGVFYGKAFDIEDTEYRAVICFDGYEECIQLL
eukprot:434582_1